MQNKNAIYPNPPKWAVTSDYIQVDSSADRALPMQTSTTPQSARHATQKRLTYSGTPASTSASARSTPVISPDLGFSGSPEDNSSSPEDSSSSDDDSADSN